MRFQVLAQITFACITLLSFTPVALHAETPHLEDLQPHAEIITRYNFTDLGRTRVDAEKLSNLPTKMSSSPRINNKGLAALNRSMGGMILVPSAWEYVPTINNVLINVHAINDKGDMLLTLNRGSDSTEWMLWPLHEGGYGEVRKHIQTADPFKFDLVFTDMNNCNKLIGYKKIGKRKQPFIWTEDKHFRSLGAEQGLNLFGDARKINVNGHVAGIADMTTDHFPFLWDECVGLEGMNLYRNTLSPRGWIEFADLVLTDDDTIYGTYWIKHGNDENDYNNKASSRRYYAYSWEPKKGKTAMLELNGMRISAVNNAHVLIGSNQEQAVICEPGRAPVKLASLMDPKKLKGWQLIEATDINDQGKIVGYGLKRGRMHIFIAEPL